MRHGKVLVVLLHALGLITGPGKELYCTTDSPD